MGGDRKMINFGNLRYWGGLSKKSPLPRGDSHIKSKIGGGGLLNIFAFLRYFLCKNSSSYENFKVKECREKGLYSPPEGRILQKKRTFWGCRKFPIKYKIAPPESPHNRTYDPVLMRLVVLVAVIQRSGVELTYTLQLFPLFAGWGVPHRRVQASGGGGQISGKGVGLKSKKQ